MTQPRREWIRAFQRDPAALEAVAAAARSCMSDACDRHLPEECDCPDQLCTPLEFAAWMKREVERAGVVLPAPAPQPVARIHSVTRSNLAATG